MQSQVLNALKTPLVMQDLPDLEPAPDSVVIKLKAAALNRRDYWITQGRYPGMVFPIVLGSDGVGTVEKIGAEVERDFGDHDVIINPGWNWGAHEMAQSDQFTILGLPHNGTFAEMVHVPARYVHNKPQHLDAIQGAALPLAGVTAYRGLFSRGKIQTGETVLITGVGGGVATFAVQYAAAIGATPIVTSSSPAKIEQAKKLGAKEGFLYTDSEWAKKFQQQFGGADLIFDGAGGAGYAQLIDIARPGGRIVNYGGTTGAPEKFDIFRVYWKQLSLLGSTMGSESDFTAMLKFVDQHRIVPAIDRVFEFTEANSALQRICDCAQFGKIVIRILQ
jgi:NADPH:quinone reductase-like Zn-dependent oxidoreductase